MSEDADSQNESDIRSLWTTIADREARLLALVEASAQIVWVIDKDGNVLGDPPLAIAHLTWSSFIGIDRVILKPNTIDELGSTLDALCKELRSRRT